MPGSGHSNGGFEVIRIRHAEGIPQALLQTGAHVTELAQSRAPVKSGALRRSIQMRVLGPRRVLVGIIAGPASAYARIQDVGGTTPAHVIVPKNRKTKSGRPPALFWKGAAHPVRRVNHPGSKIPGNHYFTSSVEEGFVYLKQQLRALGGGS